MDTIHAAGGLVFADVASMRHVERALQVGVDGRSC
jgi:NAD(P)H-dependent flavin oxidoreductase YrpB (nitropropane dioxygenase family)